MTAADRTRTVIRRLLNSSTACALRLHRTCDGMTMTGDWPPAAPCACRCHNGRTQGQRHAAIPHAELQALREVIRDLVDEVTVDDGVSWTGTYTDHCLVIGPFTVDVLKHQADAVRRALENGSAQAGATS